MFGYLFGAYTTSITLGLLIVFSLNDSGATSTAKNTLSPSEDIVVGLLLVARRLRPGPRGATAPVRRRQRRVKEAKAKDGAGEGVPWPERMWGRGLGPGNSLQSASCSPSRSLLPDGVEPHRPSLTPGQLPTVLLVVGFCLIQQLLLKLPLLGYAIAPEWTQDAVVRFRAWLGRKRAPGRE